MSRGNRQQTTNNTNNHLHTTTNKETVLFLMVLGQFRAEHLSVSEPPTNLQTNNFTNQSSNDKTTTTITSMIMTFLASGPAHFGNTSARRIAQANQLMVLQQQWSQSYHSWQLLSEVHVTVPSLGYVMKWSWDDPSCSSLEFSESMQVLLLSHTTRNPRICPRPIMVKRWNSLDNKGLSKNHTRALKRENQE